MIENVLHRVIDISYLCNCHVEFVILANFIKYFWGNIILLNINIKLGWKYLIINEKKI